MTAPTPSGACFCIMVPVALYQQTAESHLEVPLHPLARRYHQTKVVKLNERNALVLTVRWSSGEKQQMRNKSEARCLFFNKLT